MVVLSEFERQRQENIRRNKELLRQLDLDSIHDSIAREVPDEKPKSVKRRKPSPKVKQEIEPSRRSRRIAGINMENTEEVQKMREEEEERDRRRKEMERLKQTRLYGDFQLLDLITDRKGNLKFEDKVLGATKSDGTNDPSVKLETETAEEVLDISSDNEVLKLFRELGDKMSAGDFYDLIRRSDLAYTDKILQAKRKEFDELKVLEKFDPLDIKITHQRITSLNFHPSTTGRVIAGGDTNGNVGIWAVDASGDDPTISIVKPHGKSVSKILAPFNAPSQFLTASYDGSVRRMDLNKLESTEVAYLNDPYESSDYPLGVSDINVCMDNPSILYMTTLSGNFYQHDLRTKFKLNGKQLLRLHDKKIGSFAINPNASHQIASASLDRTLRIWDLRNVGAASWSEFDTSPSPHPYGAYGSRLSVSCVDWNLENRIVCNGYDDNICIFDLSGNKQQPAVTQWSTDYQVPGKKTQKSEEDEIPTNLEPFTRIRHNCQTGRWVSILKSKWQVAPEDGVQKFVIANMNRGFDIYDQKGQILAHLTGSNVGAVPAVCSMHPTQNWCAGGSASGKVYMFE
ncbi:hypothetical protein PSN45_001535 [Yamadazyma tenuis]|uniref:DNA damage-binding protein CMR1 n=1 Tax=Candida tenuis (strain ATCC 10573 / BCRC 21748 / CBS 615 / JCM 9827 / NBRC 10315 / NRRL Y-1498 / VKM Y-70) TaxID=590646 RepID=G3BFH0_CANTC|nr:WD40 repeat-like protein [Yamadazyma tenuis ATCC 10573]EGV60691.1 WD40 repeat-like protein [Yamadazyma tenuis ATCC 10573]WEJ94057.1 hypothetical protein PSN45_001535 [Yamadazyma tenuis]